MGTAQDGGVPQIGCKCYNCKSVVRSAASIALIENGKAIIIDITPDFRIQYCHLTQKYNVQLEAIYLTHAHWGHYGGLMLLGKEGWNVQGMPVYLSQDFYDFLYINDPFADLIKAGNILWLNISEDASNVHGITSVRVPHRDEYSDTYGFLFDLNGKRTLYLPCCDEFTPELYDLIKSVDLAIIDGTFYSDAELPNRVISKIPHPRILDSIEKFADVADKIIFTHFNHTNPLLNEGGIERKHVEQLGFRIASDWDVIE